VAPGGAQGFAAAHSPLLFDTWLEYRPMRRSVWTFQFEKLLPALIILGLG
jgi:hypothetical protein